MIISILFVDEDAHFLHNLEQMLRPTRTKWDCQFAPEAKTALGQLKLRLCDIVVADITTPQGVKVMEAVANLYPQVIRIAFTDPGSTPDLARSGQLVHQFLPRSASMTVMQEALESAIAMRKLLVSENLKKIISRIRKLPGLPALYLEITQEIHAADPSINRIGDLIAKDAGLSAQLLKLVNSAAYGMRNSINDPAQAASLLGLETLQSLVLCADIFERYDRLAALVPNFSMTRFQQHSLTTSANATAIARRLGLSATMSNNLGMAGLLHDTGKLVLAENFPQQYAKALEEASAQNVADWTAEWSVFGATHAEVGAYLLGLWGIGGGIVEACAFHHQPHLCQQRNALHVGILHIANAFAEEGSPDRLDLKKGRINRGFLREQQLEDQLIDLFEACPVAAAAPPPPAVVIHPVRTAAPPTVHVAIQPDPTPGPLAKFWQTVRGWFA